MTSIFHKRTTDETQFNRIVRENQTFVYALCRRMLGGDDEAKDATQEIFIKVWQNLRRYDKTRNVQTWLYRIATNHCIDASRRGKTRVLQISSDEGEDTTSYSTDEQDLELAIQKLIPMLPEKQRAIFILAVIEGLSIKEIAKMLDENPGRVKSNLYYARKQMSEMLAKYYSERQKEETHEL